MSGRTGNSGSFHLRTLKIPQPSSLVNGGIGKHTDWGNILLGYRPNLRRNWKRRGIDQHRKGAGCSLYPGFERQCRAQPISGYRLATLTPISAIRASPRQSPSTSASRSGIAAVERLIALTEDHAVKGMIGVWING